LTELDLLRTEHEPRACLARRRSSGGWLGDCLGHRGGGPGDRDKSSNESDGVGSHFLFFLPERGRPAPISKSCSQPLRTEQNRPPLTVRYHPSRVALSPRQRI